ncbi:unnamed protein product [Sphenostylis stenocarpa]|uniref:Uncharacterized protein n=1 Tax=Sphenostylis stenocarpa TaxID=92480 RepID=A0AA86T9G4_9FABA|nr:unnamed protein product [Sphenostylis stenocarpa]
MLTFFTQTPSPFPCFLSLTHSQLRAFVSIASSNIFSFSLLPPDLYTPQNKMGNCLVLCIPSSGSCIMAKKVKLVKVAKPDGKILEFSTPIHVKDILTNYPAYGVGVSKEVAEPLPPDHELKAGRLYYLLPSLHSPPNLASLRNVETSCGIKRVKVIITKHQLEQLVNKQISVEDILSEVRTVGVKFPNNRKPKLDSIPEENE